MTILIVRGKSGMMDMFAKDSDMFSEHYHVQCKSRYLTI